MTTLVSPHVITVSMAVSDTSKRIHNVDAGVFVQVYWYTNMDLLISKRHFIYLFTA